MAKKTRSASQSEGDISREIRAWAEKHPDLLTIFRVQSGHMRGAGGTRVIGAPPGTPDLCGFCCHGRFLGWEVKTIEGTTSDAQDDFGERCLAAGGGWSVIRSVSDAEEAIRHYCSTHAERL